jgi:uncharacterized membrane protein
VIPAEQNLLSVHPKRRLSFAQDFRQFFLRGIATLLPTLITLWLLVWAWNFLWESLGRHLILGIKWTWAWSASTGLVRSGPGEQFWSEDNVWIHVTGVLLAVLLVYIVGVVVGNFIGRTAWRLLETGLMRAPLVRAIYPAVKQVTDFVLASRRTPFTASNVVAVQPHESGIWSIGLVTGRGPKPLAEMAGEEMVTVFIPSTPTAFTGYVLVVPRGKVVELPLTVEEAMRMLVSGGVIVPEAKVQELSSSGVR